MQTLQVFTLIRLCCFAVGLDVNDAEIARDPVVVLMRLQRRINNVDAVRAHQEGEHAERLASLARSLALALDQDIEPEALVTADGCDGVLRALIGDARETREAFNALASDLIVNEGIRPVQIGISRAPRAIDIRYLKAKSRS